MLDKGLKREKGPRIGNVAAHEYATELFMHLSQDDPNITTSNRFDSRSMSWLTKLRVIIRKATSMPNRIMDDASWIGVIVAILKEQNIHFLPGRTKSGLSAVCFQVIVYPQPQGSGVRPRQQATEVVNPEPSQTATTQSSTTLPFSLPLNEIPECLSESIQKEVDIWKKSQVDADKICDIEKRQFAKERAAALETFFTKSYATLDLTNHYHRSLVTTGLILRLSNVIPSAEKDRPRLDWVYKHSCHKDKDRWLLMFVVIGVYHASRELQMEMENLLSKPLRDNIKTTLSTRPEILR